jgi:eukaryotic-like serine/threonine-protein kinase
MAESLVGSVVAGRYQVMRPLSRGGMAEIYVVRHVDLNRDFVLKRLGAQLADNADALARFRREAKAIAALRHRHVVEVVDWATLDDGAPAMILELLTGEDLAARIDRTGPLAWRDLWRIADQALSALAAAHKIGIVHRDLKPANLFLARDDSGEEQVKLLDFGLSKVRDPTAALTGENELMGTPEYMSPEQADGHAAAAGTATDVFAMGAILYEMATGRMAFGGGALGEVILRVQRAEPEPIATRRSDVPPELVALVKRMLAKDAAQRPRAVDEVRRELASIFAAAPAHSIPPPAAPDVPRPAARQVPPPAAQRRPITPAPRGEVVPKRRRARAAGAIVGALAAVAVASAAIVLWTMKRGPDASATTTAQAATAAPSPLPPAARIEIRATPPGARLVLDGRAIDGALLVPADAPPRTVRVSAPGYVDKDVAVDGHTPSPLVVELAPVPAAPPPPTAPGARHAHAREHAAPSKAATDPPPPPSPDSSRPPGKIGDGLIAPFGH